MMASGNKVSDSSESDRSICRGRGDNIKHLTGDAENTMDFSYQMLPVKIVQNLWVV